MNKALPELVLTHTPDYLRNRPLSESISFASQQIDQLHHTTLHTHDDYTQAWALCIYLNKRTTNPRVSELIECVKPLLGLVQSTNLQLKLSCKKVLQDVLEVISRSIVKEKSLLGFNSHSQLDLTTKLEGIVVDIVQVLDRDRIVYPFTNVLIV